MDFIRKKKRGQNKKTQRTWFSAEGYRLFWRKEAYGVTLVPRFMACVRVLVPNFSRDWAEGRPEEFLCWDFVDHRHHLYKTMRKAQEACERHLRLWSKAIEATGVRGLVEIFGRLPGAIPLWAAKKLPRKVHEALTRPAHAIYEEEECTISSPAACEPNPSGPIATSLSSADDSFAAWMTEAGPASPVMGGGASSTRIAAGEKPSAPPAEALAGEPRPPAAKPTKRRLCGSARKPVTTKHSSKPAKKRSASSRQNRSVPSRN